MVPTIALVRQHPARRAATGRARTALAVCTDSGGPAPVEDDAQDGWRPTAAHPMIIGVKDGWGGDVAALRARLENSAGTAPAERTPVCAAVAAGLFAAGLDRPPFPVDAGEPWLSCARVFWALRIRAEPGVTTAVACARWLRDDSGLPAERRSVVAWEWSFGFGVEARASVESDHDLTAPAGALTGRDTSEVYAFAAVFHAAKLYANLRFDDLGGFLEGSALAMGAGEGFQGGALVTALRGFAARGDRRHTAAYADGLLDRAWAAAPGSRQVVEVCLHALALAAPGHGVGERLCARAGEAVTTWPDDHVLWGRLAAGQRLCGRAAEARVSIDTALRQLLDAGKWDSPARTVYLRERDLIGSMPHPDAGDVGVPAPRPVDTDLAGAVPRLAFLALFLVGGLVVLVAAGTTAADVSWRTRLGQEALLAGSLLALAAGVCAALRLLVRRWERTG
ncbi:hypothetical protein [Frankia sp. R43]|uniref:hypothetical protein n=1 Tax=Frankia sp. R43 TaxID=269536 RepID=UPI0006CA1568|nr:hypothetical protein [Frankia sp. R43]